jgi:glycosyltransferase involved in cell wall biosynthesis
MISIVIPAYNEEANILRCLDAFTKQTVKEEFEVIIVDNNSTDKTSKIASGYKNKLNLKIFLENKKGRGAARARGFKEARGSIIFSTDADTIVPVEWIERFEKRLNKNIGAVTGSCRISDCAPITNFIFNIFQPLSMRVYRTFFGHYWLSGFSFAVKKDIYEKSGGFNDLLNAQEDIDLSFKVSKLTNIEFISDLPVEFSGRRFKNGLILGLIPYFATFISVFLYKKNSTTLSDVR